MFCLGIWDLWVISEGDRRVCSIRESMFEWFWICFKILGGDFGGVEDWICKFFYFYDFKICFVIFCKFCFFSLR